MPPNKNSGLFSDDLSPFSQNTADPNRPYPLCQADTSVSKI